MFYLLLGCGKPKLKGGGYKFLKCMDNHLLRNLTKGILVLGEENSVPWAKSNLHMFGFLNLLPNVAYSNHLLIIVRNRN